jgi:recombination protein RecT
MGNALTKHQENTVVSVQAMLEKSQAEFLKVLPKQLPVDYFFRVAITSFRKTPKLLECTPYSILASMIQSAQLGLLLDGVLGEAYLIPYGSEAKFQPGYKGLIKLAVENGDVRNFSARAVYGKDLFEWELGTSHFLRHKPPLTGERGERIAAYAIAIFKDGSTAFEIMTQEEVLKVKAASKGKDKKDSPWNNWEDSMWAKSAIIKLAKRLPLSRKFQLAASLSEHYDMGLDVSNIQKATEQKTDTLTDKLKNANNVEVSEPATEPTPEPDPEFPPEIPKADIQAIRAVHEMEDKIKAKKPNYNFKQQMGNLGHTTFEEICGNAKDLDLYGSVLSKVVNNL